MVDMEHERGSDRYVVISTDGHCGADLWDYKPYLDARYHEEFDDWARAYHDPWADFDREHHSNNRMGMASFAAPMNWDSKARLELTEDQGIAAEVLFPNTAPPFIPSGSISAPGPRTAEEYEYRFAGLRAHNRWLADFCREVPGRRAGLAQVFLNDVDAAIREVCWAKENGLMGVLLPADNVLQLVNLYYPEFDPFWKTCAELGMPVHRHTSTPSETEAVGGPAAPWIGLVEVEFYGTRAIAHMICTGIFERYPNLYFISTELLNGRTIPSYLARLDRMYESELAGTSIDARISSAVAAMRKAPSAYFASNCFMGGPMDIRAAYDAGTPNLMFGADIPHSEGTAPFTTKALRLAFSDLPEDDLRKILSGNAARAYGFDLAALQLVADEIGPTVDDVRRPLPKEEYPKFPTETRYRMFDVAA
jgi:predicted TIM-barrel fold metal-dependent hydrolase